MTPGKDSTDNYLLRHDQLKKKNLSKITKQVQNAKMQKKSSLSSIYPYNVYTSNSKHV